MAIQVREWIDRAISVVEILAPLTANTLDDATLSVLRAIKASEELLNWLQGVLDGWAQLPPGVQPSTQVLPEAAQRFERQGIALVTVTKFLSWLPVLIDIMQKLGTLNQSAKAEHTDPAMRVQNS
jgi:hypothetical protein